ncbi:putative DNA modification/repair radical SAM protein [Rhodopirellula sp. MGV]|uniref:putative DNA modification/repair radical SAM protein n=1 Tax=Rhodopirellula sp. MGV TaxID=2023130 RepID=UPI000B95D0D5|nr:putative DNA modification/repair radical SAM protein [Rhodopirellula sp. MGV]OYP30383.1 putative DNA modification/repair radical SAM protein [Rhodopirellula sp. MGV]PNY34753.1 putative DNA modification/repair radical SAM protein [Rhodopirellula baltica]
MSSSSIESKLAILADAAKYDASCASSGSKRKSSGGLGSTEGMGICHSYTPDGRCVSLLKILLTNVCIFDCQYCVNRVSSNTPRARLSVEEVVRLTMDFYRRNYIEGLFLSSGIIRSSDYTMSQLVEVAETLRTRESFRGYIHLKTIPGANEELIERAGLFADRLSVNVELPTITDLKTLAPEKKRDEIEDTMGRIHVRREETAGDQKKGMKAPKFAPAGQSTQMIVGATQTSDRDILDTSSHLYRTHRLRRVYYSAFSPIPHADSRLPGTAPPLLREHRLYQADWLIRFYGFDANELTTPDQANLSLDLDPKHAWALANREVFPIDVNRASRELLLRVPGVGERGVKRILSTRRYHAIRDEDLAKLGIVYRRARPFLITSDRHPGPLSIDSLDLKQKTETKQRQLMLFDAMGSAQNGQV